MTDSASTRRDRWIGLMFLLLVSAGWGFNWVVMKNLIAQWPPLTSRGSAGIVGALGLLAVAMLSGQRLAVERRYWLRLIRASLLNVTAWMGIGGITLIWLTAGEAAIVAYTMPAWAALLAYLIIGERFTWTKAVALALGIAGVIILFSGHSLTFGLGKVWGILAALGAAIGFAIGTVLMKRDPLPLPPLVSTAWQLLLGCIPMLLAGFVFESARVSDLDALGWASLVWFGFITLGACYLFWFAALRRLPAGVAAIGTFLVPVIGVLAGAAILGEPFGWRELIALCCTGVGILLATRAPAH